MNTTHWKRAKQVFHEALDKSGPERAGFVASACGEDRELRAQVQALLAAHDEAGEFLTSPTVPEADEAARAAATLTASAPTERPGATIGPYKLLQVIGEGGFGVVYMAEQEQPVRRRVALKIIKLGMDTKQVIARFEAERQALALMEHPNIARVLEAGATETGRPYFVMELVKGVPITEYCDSNRLTTRERLGLFNEVCGAVQHAHQKGIVHRDIKPSNVLVTLHDGKPVPKVIDFGIAKATSQRLTEKTLFTAYGQFIGTPVYMSPEQAEMSGLDVDTRSDIYSLGVLLYELLTGTTPFDIAALREAGYAEIQRIIKEEEPPKPSTRLSTLEGAITDIAKHRRTDPNGLSRLVRGDLDWIVMQALEKDRTRRYASASEFAADVGRHLGDEPVAARPPTAAYKFRKYVKKHKGPVSAVAAVVVTALALGSVALWQARLAERRAVLMQRQAELARANSILASASASTDPLAKALLVLELKDLPGLSGRLNVLQEAASEPLPAAVLRGNVKSAVFDPDGTPLAATLSENGTVRIAPVDGSGTPVVLGAPDESINNASFSPDGAQLATVSDDGTVRIWQANGTGEPIVLRGHEQGAWKAFFSPDGRYLAGLSFTDPTVWVWRTDGTGEPVALRGHSQIVYSPNFSPDSTRVVTASLDRTARVWSTDGTGEPVVLRGHEKGVWQASFSPDGSRVLTASLDGTARVWRADGTGDAIVLRKPDESAHDHPSRRYVRGAVFSPDGTQVVTTYADATARLWTLAGQEDPIPLRGHSDEVWSAGFSRDGARVVTFSKDGTARIWQAHGGRRDASVLRHEGEAISATFNAEGTQLLTTSKDGTARLWRVTGAEEPVVLRGHGSSLFGVAFSPDGDRLATTAVDGAVRVWRADGTGEPTVIRGHEAIVSSVAFSPDGTRLITGSWDKTARVWSADGTGDPLVLRGHEDRIMSVAFGPDGARVLTGAEDGTARVWRADGSGEPVVLQHDDPVWTVAFGPDGSRVATGTRNGTARAWRVDDAGDPIVFRGHTNAVMGVAFSLDGTRLVTGSADGTARVWHSDGRGEPVILRHTNEVSSVAFSPDGTRVVTGSWDNMARVWSIDGSGKPLLLRGHIHWVNGVSFSPDGSRVVTASADHTARVWRIRLPELTRYLSESVQACLTPEQRIRFLVEPASEARATYAACERGYGREPNLLESF